MSIGGLPDGGSTTIFDRPYEPLDQLRAQFELHRLTVSAVARRCHISRSHLSDVLWGRKRLTPRLAEQIHMVTGIEVEPNGGPECLSESSVSL